MITLKQLSAEHPDFPKVEKLYETAFPVNERVEDIPALLSNFPVKLLGIYPSETPDQFAGFFLVFDDGKFLYLGYFAICPEMRSGGIGGKAMQALVELYRGRQLMFSYESVRQPSDNAEQRERRRSFYLRNGFHESPWYAKLGDTEFVLCSSEEPADIEAFKSFLRQYAHIEPEFYTYQN